MNIFTNASFNSTGTVLGTLDDKGTLTLTGTGNIDNQINKSITNVISGSYTLNKIIISSGITGITVTAFTEGCEYVKSIYISDTVETLTAGMFKGCSSLEELTLPFCGYTTYSTNNSKTTWNYTTTAGANLGYYFGTTSYTGSYRATQSYGSTSAGYQIPTTLTKLTILKGIIQPYSFHNCTSLQYINFGSGVTYIHNNPFTNCSGLLEIDIPNTVIKAYNGTDASGCSSLKKYKNLAQGYYYNDIINAYMSGCGALEFLETNGLLSWNSSVLSQYPFGYIFGTASYTGGKATQQYLYKYSSGRYSRGSSYTYYIPQNLKTVISHYRPYTNNYGFPIGYGMFYNCSMIETIVLDTYGFNTYYGCGDYAFYGCSSLKNVVIRSDAPDARDMGVRTIQQYAFSGCTSMENLFIKGTQSPTITSTGNDVILTLDPIYYSDDYLDGAWHFVDSMPVMWQLEEPENILARYNGRNYKKCIAYYYDGERYTRCKINLYDGESFKGGA